LDVNVNVTEICQIIKYYNRRNFHERNSHKCRLFRES